jgi:asparagine synthase (glutamine-hydrolysing)
VCGIAGVLGAGAAGAIDGMVDAMRHRGPDGRGVYRERGVALGAARLAIVSPRDGAQPMVDGPLVLVANAEIYNHRALRDELSRGGARFATECDIEVILHGYRTWGPDVVRRLCGFFAFALWDAERGHLLVARDRFGIAPLVMWRGAHMVAIASEVKGLCALPGFSPRLEVQALDHLLAQRHVGVERSLFAEVEPVQPGSYAVLDREGRGAFRRWYRAPASGSGVGPAGGLAEASANLGLALDQATATRLGHGDAPVGLYLSGGIDSSIIAACAGRANPGAPAFSHGYDPAEDELAFAEMAAGLSGGPWHAVQLIPDDLDALPAIVRAMEEPVANADVIGLWALAREASRHVKAVLCGEGADELFGSYPHQQLLDRAARHPHLARAAAFGLRHAPAAWMRGLGPYPGAMADPSARERLVDALTLDSLDSRLERVTALFDAPARAAIYTPELAAAVRAARGPAGRGDERAGQGRPGPDATLDRLIDRDLTDWLPAYHLGRENRIAMAWGLETRYPFLDDAVVEAVLPLPRSYKVGWLPPAEKRLLRRIADERLPNALAKRPKGPVRVPLSLFGARWPAMARDLLTPARLASRGLFDPAAVASLMERAERQPFVAGRQLFALVLVELWCEQFGA